MNTADLTYRKAAAEGASGFGLLIALYDTLAHDFRRAAAAQRAGDLEQRSKEIKHALTVLAVLENWIENDDGKLARRLKAFYSELRRKSIEAQAQGLAGVFEDLMAETLRIREVWQQMESSAPAAGPEILPPLPAQRQAGPYSVQAERRQFDWSA